MASPTAALGSPRAGFGNTGRTGSTTAPATPAAPAAPTTTSSTNGYQAGSGAAYVPPATTSTNTSQATGTGSTNGYQVGGGPAYVPPPSTPSTANTRTGVDNAGVAPSPFVSTGRSAGMFTPPTAAPAATPDPTLSWNVYDQSTHTGTPTPEQFAAYSQRVQAQMAASNASGLQQQMSQYGVTGDNYWTHPSNIPMPGYLLAQLSPQQQAQYSGAPAQSFQPDPAMNQAIYANRVSQLYGSPGGGMTQSALSNPYAQFGASQPQNPNYGNNQMMMLLNLLSSLGLGSSQNQFGNGYNPMFSGSYGNLLGNNTRYY